MKKIMVFEVVEYPAPSVFISEEVFIGDVRSKDDPDDIFGVLKTLQDVPRNIPRELKSGIWKHFKPGKVYRVIGVAFREETQQWLVIYKSLYGSEEYPEGTFWGRSVDEFLGTKEVDGIKVPRFEYVTGGLLSFFMIKGWSIVMFEGREYYLLDLRTEEVVRFAEEFFSDRNNSLVNEERVILSDLIDEEKEVLGLLQLDK